MNSSNCFQAVNSRLFKQLDRKIEKESAITTLGSGHAALPEVEVPFSIVRKISTRNLEKNPNYIAPYSHEQGCYQLAFTKAKKCCHD